MNYQQIVFIIEADLAETSAEWLEERGAISVTFSEAENEPLFQVEVNEAPLWRQTKVSAFYHEDFNVKPIVESLNKHFPEIENINIETVEDQDWVRITQENFPTQCYADNLWIIPSWEKPEAHCHNVVRIDPGLAFGTGTHATTSMCLEYLAKHPPAGLTVVDYGCGSGILALAALTLGAKKVYAIDHDEQALISTSNNAKMNDFVNSENLVILSTKEIPEIKSPLILANILAKPLIDLSKNIVNLCETSGVLILSGLLYEEKQHVINAYRPQCKLKEAIKKEEWALLELQKTK